MGAAVGHWRVGEFTDMLQAEAGNQEETTYWCDNKTKPLFKKFFKAFVYFYRQREREGERAGEKHPHALSSRAPPTGDLAHNPGMCSHWESNHGPSDSQASTQSTEPH